MEVVLLILGFIILYCVCGAFYVKGRRTERKKWMIDEKLRKREI